MSVPPPSNLPAGALEIAYISTYNASGMGTPSGWRLLDTVVVDGQYGPNYLYVLDRFYQSSDTSYTFGSNNLNYPEVVIRAFSGVNQSTPVRAYNDNNSPGTASVTAPALSASTVANEMQVAFFADDNAPSVTSIKPSLNDFAAGSAQYGTLEGDLRIPAVGTIPQAITGNASAGGNWMASVIELEPASGNSTPTPTPDPTSTVAPTATPTPQSTSTPAPAATSTPAPAATSTPAPTASATPTPNPSAMATPGVFQPVQGYTNTEVAQGTDPTLATDWATDGGRWMQNQVLDMAVSPAGEIYLANYWSEGLMVNGMYHFSSGKGVSDGPLPCNGANWGGGYGAASNSRYLWISDRATGGGGNSIWKFNVNGTANSCSSVSTGIDGGTGSAGEFADIMGLTASDSGGNGGQGELFVADAAGDKILVYDAASMAKERQFSFAPGGTAMQPRRIAYDPGSGTLWISSGLDRYDFHGAVYHYSTAGAQLSGTISDVSIPTALAVDQGNLWVGDSGADMQLKVYNATTGARLTGSCSWGSCGSFGVQGGYLAGPTPGLAGPNRLEFPISVRFDSSHNLYVAQSMPPAGTWAWGCWICDGSNVEQFNVGPNNVAYDAAVREYSPSGALIAEMRANTEIEDVGALDAGTDGADMFNAWNHFKMDWTQAPTGEWSYAGTTIDPIHYPSDIRIAMLDSNNVPFAHRVITINGVRYLFVTGQDGGHQGIFHRPAGSDIFVPDAAFNNRSLDGWVMTSDNTSLQPCYRDGCGYIWSDTNGDGAPQASEFQQLPNSEVGNVTNFDDDGNAWTAGSDGILRRFRVSGFGATGGLQYSASAIDNFGQPAPFNDVAAAWYDVASDTLFVSGFTASAPNNGESVDGKWVAGSTVAAYPNWSQGNRSAKWVSALPYNSNSLTGTARAWQEAGGKLFFLQASGKTVFVYDANSGQHLFDIVGHMPGTPDPGAVNWNAGWDDSLQTLTAFQRSDGEYIVTLETLMADRISVMRGLLNNNVSQ